MQRSRLVPLAALFVVVAAACGGDSVDDRDGDASNETAVEDPAPGRLVAG